MHSPVKNPGAVPPELLLASALAKHLLSPSTQFEDPVLSSRAATQDGLKCLATLDKPTRLSLPIAPVAQPAQATPGVGAPPPPTAAAPEAPSVQYGTRKPEYKDGLRDTAVVEALLNYHSRKRPLGAKEAPLSAFRPLSPGKLSQPALKPGTTRIFRSRGDF